MANTKNKRKPSYIVTSNTTAVRQIKIKIDSFITNELALKVVARHKTFRAKTKSLDRKSTRLNSSHSQQSRMPSSA